MPDPREWPIVLARLKAAGFNAVSIYVPWGYHEFAPGKFRYDGRYDVERFLSNARDAGLYVVVRHGPYVQGEMDAGGFPPWLLGRPGVLRTTDPAFTAAGRRGTPRCCRASRAGSSAARSGGRSIALQIENEYPGDGAGPDAYMADQYEEARRDGITVPILHNNQQLLGVAARAAALRLDRRPVRVRQLPIRLHVLQAVGHVDLRPGRPVREQLPPVGRRDALAALHPRGAGRHRADRRRRRRRPGSALPAIEGYATVQTSRCSARG